MIEVQIIEVTELGVRSAVIRLRQPGTPLTIVVYPMIHMAERDFYRSVSARLRQADVIVAEGVGAPGEGRSLLVGALQLSYTVLRLNRRMRVVRQDLDYARLGVPVVCPDVSNAEFRTGWRAVPLAQRLAMWCVLPVVIVSRLFGATRLVWSAATMEVNDLPSPDEEDIEDAMPELTAAFQGERDRRLLDALSALHVEHRAEAMEIAVVYGAAHVPAIVHGMLVRHGYRPRSADWLTIIDF